MFLSVVLWALGAFGLLLFTGMLLSIPKAVGSLVKRGINRKPPESPLGKFVEEWRRHREPRGS